MGKEVSYCQVCGDRLGVGESLDARIYVHEGRRYCGVCRPAEATAKIPALDRKKSSTKVRAQPPAPRVRETTRIRKRGGWRLAAIAASVTGLAVGIAIAAGGSAPASRTPPPPAAAPAAAEPRRTPSPDSGPSLDELLGRVREIRQSDLMFERRDEVRRLLAEAARRAGPRVEEVDLLAAEVDRAFEEAAARLADFTRAEAARMAAKGKLAEAIERLDGYPASFAPSKAAATLRLLREEYERRKTVPPLAPPTSPRRLVGAPAWSGI